MNGDISARFTLPESALPKRFVEITTPEQRRAEQGRLRDRSGSDLDSQGRRLRDRSSTTGGPA